MIDNGLLYSALADAALITRLLNDVGTHLLQMTTIERIQLYQKMQSYINNHQFDSIFTCLSFLTKDPEFLLPLIRIRKDLQHGEFNICLDPLAKKQQ